MKMQPLPGSQAPAWEPTSRSSSFKYRAWAPADIGQHINPIDRLQSSENLHKGLPWKIHCYIKTGPD